MDKTKKSKLYLNTIFFLLYFIVLQDFVLAFLYKLIGNEIIIKLFFYSKDIIFVGLFLYVLLFRKLPKKLFVGVWVFLFCVCISGIVALFNHIGLKNLLENVRGVILLPGFICIGYCIPNKKRFINHLTRRYFPFLVACAVFGIAEYVLDKTIGTKNFWFNTIGITNFYSDIKGQSGRLVNGLPGNFYGQYGNEFFSQKRLVGFWMGPLTAGYALLIPTLYYFLSLINSKKDKAKNLLFLIILLTAVYLTHTRAILIVFAIAVFTYSVVNFRKNNYYNFAFIAGLLFIMLFLVLNFDKIYSFVFDGSTIGHISSIQVSLSRIKLSLFGEGFGSYGVNGNIGTESIYLTVLGDMGVVGLAFYLFVAFYFVFKVIKAKKNLILNLVLYCSIAYLITGLISEQLIAYTSIMPFYLLLGCADPVCLERREIKMNLNQTVSFSKTEGNI